ncbi:MAG: hypothetical protein KY461_09345 [Actinobacteria bacterium]|nr:hypothetical protein [Actinomycetota bacterium]
MATLCVVLAGCSDTGSPDEGPAPTDEASAVAADGFRQELGRVTTEYADRAGVLQAELAAIDATDETRLLEVVEALEGTAVASRAAFADLAIPAPVSAEMTLVLQLLDDQANALEELARSVRERDTETFRAATDELIAIAQRSIQARQRLDLALASCGTACGP